MNATAEYHQWRQQGIELRKKLEAERLELVQRVSQLDQAIASLPTDEGGMASGVVQVSLVSHQEVPLARPVVLPRDLPVIDMVRDILKVAEEPLTARQIHALVIQARPGVTSNEIQKALYRLFTLKGEVIRFGEKPNTSYTWVGGGQQKLSSAG